MRRAFTLVEMLIVVAILAVLMSIMFRLGGMGDSDQARANTVMKLQRIENCLSGYYAAFGSYPPVKNHGSHDITMTVDENGDQSDSGGGENQSEDGSSLVWSQVEAACRCQPFGCEYPGDEYDNQTIETWSQELQERVNNAGDYPKYAESAYADIYRQQITGPNPNSGFQSQWSKSADWSAIKLFKFGVMSYLLPRYLFMMGGDGKFFGIGGKACKQWDDNNDMPCDPFEGVAFDVNGEGWEDVRNYAQTDATGSKQQSQLIRVVNIPSQAVCARWMPNLEGLCVSTTTKTFFGVTVTGSSGLELSDEYPPDPGTHYPPDNKQAYKNATVTIYDNWGNEFYYYSPPPYQSYVLWSAGPNGKTFPPWMPVDKLGAKDKETAIGWKSDDVIKMSN